MRDVGKVKDRFELKLDSNRVFFLFAGLTAYSALVFVLGVVVGRSARPEPGGTVASAPVLLPDEQPTPKRIEDRLADAQPKATEEPEIPLKEIWKLDNPGGNSLTGSITPSTTPSAAKTPAPTPTAAAAASPAKTAAPAATSVAPADAKFTLQVIAYNDLEDAQSMESSLKARGFDAYTVTAQIAGKGTVHRVRVGRFASRPNAESAASQLAAETPGIKPLVVAYE